MASSTNGQRAANLFTANPLSFRSKSDARLDRRVAGFAGANSVNRVEVHDENLAVADLAGLRGRNDRLDDTLREIVADRNLDLHLGQEVDHVLRAAIQLRVAALTAKPLHLGDRHTLDAHVRERVADVVQAKRFDDCGNQLHWPPKCRDRVPAGRANPGRVGFSTPNTRYSS